MSLPPTSNGIMPRHYSPPVRHPLLPHQSELSGYDRSQPNSWDTDFSNLYHTGSFNPTASFPTWASNVPDAPQDPAQPESLDPSHFPFLSGQPLLDPIPPTEPPAMLDGSGQHLSANQTFQAWSAFAGRPGDAIMAPSAAPPSPSSSHANRPAPLRAMSSVRSAQAQFPGVGHAGLGSRNLSAAGGGSARPARSRSGRVSYVGSARGRRRPRERERARPLVRVEDRIEWVRHDVMKMTLLFNWSPYAEAEVHEPWG